MFNNQGASETQCGQFSAPKMDVVRKTEYEIVGLYDLVGCNLAQDQTHARLALHRHSLFRC